MIGQNIILDAQTNYSSSIPRFNTSYKFPLNISFLGFNKSVVDVNYLNEYLPKWHSPIIRSLSIQYGRVISAINYTLDYTYTFLNQEQLNGYEEFMALNSLNDLPPDYISRKSANYIPSDMAENYIKTNFMGNSPTLFIINTYNGSVEAPHYYYSQPYQFQQSSSTEITGGGHNSRFIWLDLSAGPTKYMDFDLWYNSNPLNGVNETLVPPIWKYNFTKNEYNLSFMNNLIKYIRTAIELKFLPSYDVETAHPIKKFKLQFIEIKTVDSITDLFKYIDKEAIQQKYSEINPNVEWEYDTLSWDWKQNEKFASLLQNARDETTKLYDDRQFVSFFDNYYNQIVDSKTNDIFVIPIFLLILPDNYRFIWNASSQNVAGKSAYILFPINAENYNTYFNLPISFCTAILMHEIGHAIGLNHPFDGYSWTVPTSQYDYNYQYWLWDFTYTQMSYVGIHQDIAKMDIDTLQRGAVISYATMIRDNIIHYINENKGNLSTRQNEILSQIRAGYKEIEPIFENVTNSFNYQTALQMMYKLIHKWSDFIQTSSNIDKTIILLISSALLIIFVIIIKVRKKIHTSSSESKL